MAEESRDKNVEKRIDDIKHINIAVLSVISMIFVAFTIFAAFSIDSEKERLLEYRDETKEKIEQKIKEYDEKINLYLNKPKKEAKIEFLTLDQRNLSKNILEAKIITDKGFPFIEVKMSLKNIGSEYSDPMFIKIYSNDSLMVSNYRNSSLPSYDYQHIIPPDVTNHENLSIIPPHMSLSTSLLLPLYDEKGNRVLENKAFVEKIGSTYDIRMEAYYGEEASETEFKINIVD